MTRRSCTKTPGSEQLGDISAQVENVTAFSAAIMGRIPVHDTAKDTFSCKLWCHDANGEVYCVTFSGDRVRHASYEDDAIRTAVETWADTVAALA
ncbi:MAG TPA: hypothetical protein ENN85_08260 [Methanoculleus sp.]|nr:hypothetical protein [Methanoculleus sp.]